MAQHNYDDCDRQPLSATSQHPEEEDAFELFRSLMGIIDFKALAIIAVKNRLSLAASQEQVAPDITCTINQNPLAGSYNLIYIIAFSDDARWVARFPGKGSANFSELDQQRMHSDYNTMRLVRSVTNMPVPEIFMVETTANPVGAPFALMSFVEGISVSKRWFDDTWITEEKRCHILIELARYMSELHTLRFARIGCLTFDENNIVTGVGPQLNCEDTPVSGAPDQDIDSEVVTAISGLNTSDSEPQTETKAAVKHEEVVQQAHLRGPGLLADTSDTHDWGILSTSGPFDNVIEYLLDRWDDLKDEPDWAAASLAVVQLAVETIPEHLIKGDHFLPSPPDFDSQNIFVDDEGDITGIIDWDSVQTLCSIGGFARYPSWITRDWDPDMYAYGEEGYSPENSPAELSHYRQVYAAAFANSNLPADVYIPDHTKLSHIFEAIELAANNRFCRNGIVPMLLEYAFRSKMPFTFREYCDVYIEGNAIEWLRQIKEAFSNMWQAEWERD